MSQNNLEDSPWRQVSLTNYEEVITLSHAKVYVVSDSVLHIGKMIQNPTSNTVWERQLGLFKDSTQYRTLDTDAESVRSGHSHVASQPVSSSPHPVPGGMLSHSIGMPSRKYGPPSIWDTHGISRNVFANPAVSFSAPCPQELNPWSSQTSDPLHSSHAGKNENQTLVQDQKCQSGPSAKKISHPL